MGSGSTTIRPRPILLICLVLASATGCQVVGIPSERMHASHGLASGPIISETQPVNRGLSHRYSDPAGLNSVSGYESIETIYAPEGMAGLETGSYPGTGSCMGPECTPSIVPPLPGCLARFQKGEELPQAPEHPRFQPLPTRPVFSTSPVGFAAGGSSPPEYGHWSNKPDPTETLPVRDITHLDGAPPR